MAKVCWKLISVRCLELRGVRFLEVRNVFYVKINWGQVSRPLYRGCLLSEGPLLEVLLYMVVLRIQIQSHSHFKKQIPSCIDVT